LKWLVLKILILKRNLFPDNIVEISFSEHETKLEIVPLQNELDVSNMINENITAQSFIRSDGRRRNLNLLGLIFVCTVFGAALLSLGDEAKKIVEIISLLCKISIKLMTWVM
jgi:Na+/H+-dicarboxylate symporter